MWTAIIAPFKIAFLDKPAFWWTIVDESINFVILVDILITFRIAYKDEDDKLIDDPKKIAWRYIKFWFPIDVLAVFPYHWIISSTN